MVELEAQVGRMSAEEVMYHWPSVSAELLKVEHVWDTWWTLETLQMGILEDSIHVWGVGKGNQVHIFVFSTIVHYPANKMLRIFLTFGNSLDAFLPAIVATLYKFGLMRGCTYAEVIGRAGWEKKLKVHGFRPLYRSFGLPLTHMREN